MVFYKKVSLFIFCLHIFFNIHADEQYNIPTQVIPMSCAVAIFGYVYANHQASQEDARCIATKYPGAQAWYNHLIQKYPQANLDTKQFLQEKRVVYDTNKSISDRFLKWNYFYNQIYAHQFILEKIDEIYKKIITNKFVSHEEKLFLSIQEFMILSHAGHIDHNHVMKTRWGLISLFMTLEATKAWTKDFFGWHAWLESAKDDSAFYAKNIFFGEITIIFLATCLLLYQQNFQSCSYACQQADLELLENVVLFFKIDFKDEWFSDWKHIFCHDPHEDCAHGGIKILDLIAMIDREIVLRKEGQK